MVAILIGTRFRQDLLIFVLYFLEPLFFLRLRFSLLLALELFSLLLRQELTLCQTTAYLWAALHYLITLDTKITWGESLSSLSHCRAA